MDSKIKFGTDGWRGIIGFDFTANKVEMITSAVCNYLKNQDQVQKVLIGFDTRFLSDKFARTAARIFNSKNIEVYLSRDFITTPVLSTSVVKDNAALGIMITASHNPYYYNGYKIKGSYGGSATPEIISKIENFVDMLNISDFQDTNFPVLTDSDNDGVRIKDFIPAYNKHVSEVIDIDSIKNFDFFVLFDPMYGASQDIFSKILEKTSPGKIIKIHSGLNPSFGGINPEPIGENLKEAKIKLRQKRCKLALCLDGDGDRIAALGEDGNFISSHHIFAIILYYLMKYKKLKGRVIKTVSTSSIIDRICSKYGLDLSIKPIGFKYISEEILAGGVLMGGEESGGLWFEGNIPERDGIIMGLKLIEVICQMKKSVNEILNEIYDKFGYFEYRRIDYGIDSTRKEKLKNLINKGIPGSIQALDVAEVIKLDGFKYVMKDGSWIMIRPSGTEAVVRIYAESNTEEKLEKLLSVGKNIIENI